MVKLEVEAVLNYENWSCVVADLSGERPFFGLKNDDFNYFDKDKGIYAQCAAYRGARILQRGLDTDCEKANKVK